jgi:hypothetical protein
MRWAHPHGDGSAREMGWGDQADAAVVGGGGEAGFQGTAGGGEQAGQEVEVHVADELGVLGGQAAEGAVGQGYVIAVGAGFEAVLLEDLDEGEVATAEGFAVGVGEAVQGGSGGGVGGLGLLDGGRQELAGDGVLAFGEADLDLGVGAVVELRRAAGAGAGAAGTALEAEGE